MAKFRISRPKNKGSRGSGGIQKSKWRKNLDPGSTHHNSRYHLKKVMVKLKYSPSKPILSTSSNQTSVPLRGITTGQVSVDEPRKPISFVTSPVKIPFTYVEEPQSISEWRIKELFSEGNFLVLNEIIMKCCSHLNIGQFLPPLYNRLKLDVYCYREGLKCRPLDSNPHDLAILYFKGKHYLGFHVPYTDRVYLITTRPDSNMLLLAQDSVNDLYRPQNPKRCPYYLNQLKSWYDQIPSLSLFEPDERFIQHY